MINRFRKGFSTTNQRNSFDLWSGKSHLKFIFYLICSLLLSSYISRIIFLYLSYYLLTSLLLSSYISISLIIFLHLSYYLRTSLLLSSYISFFIFLHLFFFIILLNISFFFPNRCFSSPSNCLREKDVWCLAFRICTSYFLVLIPQSHHPKSFCFSVQFAQSCVIFFCHFLLVRLLCVCVVSQVIHLCKSQHPSHENFFFVVDWGSLHPHSFKFLESYQTKVCRSVGIGPLFNEFHGVILFNSFDLGSMFSLWGRELMHVAQSLLKKKFAPERFFIAKNFLLNTKKFMSLTQNSLLLVFQWTNPISRPFILGILWVFVGSSSFTSEFRKFKKKLFHYFLLSLSRNASSGFFFAYFWLGWTLSFIKSSPFTSFKKFKIFLLFLIFISLSINSSSGLFSPSFSFLFACLTNIFSCRGLQLFVCHSQITKQKKNKKNAIKISFSFFLNAAQKTPRKKIFDQKIFVFVVDFQKFWKSC